MKKTQKSQTLKTKRKQDQKQQLSSLWTMTEAAIISMSRNLQQQQVRYWLWTTYCNIPHWLYQSLWMIISKIPKAQTLDRNLSLLSKALCFHFQNKTLKGNSFSSADTIKLSAIQTTKNSSELQSLQEPIKLRLLTTPNFAESENIGINMRCENHVKNCMWFWQRMLVKNVNALCIQKLGIISKAKKLQEKPFRN